MAAWRKKFLSYGGSRHGATVSITQCRTNKCNVELMCGRQTDWGEHGNMLLKAKRITDFNVSF